MFSHWIDLWARASLSSEIIKVVILIDDEIVIEDRKIIRLEKEEES